LSEVTIDDLSLLVKTGVLLRANVVAFAFKPGFHLINRTQDSFEFVLVEVLLSEGESTFPEGLLETCLEACDKIAELVVSFLVLGVTKEDGYVDVGEQLMK
jgi:hypothetical protein